MTRWKPAPLVLGIAVGALLTGLVLPFVVGDTDARSTAVAGGTSDAGRAALTAREVPHVVTNAAVDGNAANPAPPGTPTPTTVLATANAAGSTGTAAPAEIGVTATSVKVGFLLLDVGQLSRFGISAPVVDPELLRAAFQAYLDEVNEAGGIHGRTIVPVYRSYDLTSADSQRASCVTLTEDERVFAVVGEFTARTADLCVTQEHRTLLLSTGFAGSADEVFDASGGRLFTLYPKGGRQMADLATELDRMGRLDGTRIGIVTQQNNDPGGSVGDALERALRRRGHEVIHRAAFSDDNGQAASQVPVQVQQMRTKSVDAVVLLANTVVNTQFVQAADSQGYRPAYAMNDWNYMSTDTSAQNMPLSFEGSVSLTYARAYEHRARRPETEAARDCIDRYQRRTGRSTARAELSFQSVAIACGQVGRLIAGLRAAGPTLTRATFAEGLQRVGTAIPEVDAWWARGSYLPGKFDFADELRTQEWQAACRCWIPVDDLRDP